MEQFISALIADVQAHAWAAAFVAVALFVAAALNGRATWFPWSIPQAWRIIAATLLTIAGVTVDQIANAPTWIAVLPTLIPWLSASAGVLLVEIRYARKGEDVPADVILPPAPRVSGRRGRRGMTEVGVVAICGLVMLVCAALVSLLGCAGSFELAKHEGQNARLIVGASAPSARCISLDDQAATYGAVAVGLASLAGAEGLAAIPARNDDLKLGLAIGTAATAAGAVAFKLAADNRATAWARECSSP